MKTALRVALVFLFCRGLSLCRLGTHAFRIPEVSRWGGPPACRLPADRVVLPTLDAASPRVKLQVLGKDHARRGHVHGGHLVRGEHENLSTIQEIGAPLADPRGLSDAEPERARAARASSSCS